MADRRSSALVTGGSSGLGAAVARRFCASGLFVVSCDLRAPSQLPPGGELKHVDCDVSNGAQLRCAFDEAQRAGELRVVVACAGRLHAESIYDEDEGMLHSDETFRDLIDANVVGTFNTIRHAARSMCGNVPSADGDRGVIILTSSIAGEDGQIGQLAYAASKAAIAGMTLPAARELSRYGIRVVTIAPGMFDTAMVQAMPDQVVRALERQIVYPARLGDAVEFASLVEEIVRNRYFNGSVVRLDGATRLGCG